MKTTSIFEDDFVICDFDEDWEEVSSQTPISQMGLRHLNTGTSKKHAGKEVILYNFYKNPKVGSVLSEIAKRTYTPHFGHSALLIGDLQPSGHVAQDSIYVSYPMENKPGKEHDFALDYKIYVSYKGQIKGSATAYHLPTVSQAKYVEVAEWFQYSMYNKNRKAPLTHASSRTCNHIKNCTGFWFQ